MLTKLGESDSEVLVSYYKVAPFIAIATGSGVGVDVAIATGSGVGVVVAAAMLTANVPKLSATPKFPAVSLTWFAYNYTA